MTAYVPKNPRPIRVRPQKPVPSFVPDSLLLRELNEAIRKGWMRRVNADYFHPEIELSPEGVDFFEALKHRTDGTAHVIEVVDGNRVDVLMLQSCLGDREWNLLLGGLSAQVMHDALGQKPGRER